MALQPARRKDQRVLVTAHQSILSREQREHIEAIESQKRIPRGPASSPRHRISDLHILYAKAAQFQRSRVRFIRPCPFLYRDKTQGYYDEIEHEMGGVMGTYPKDFHGDPRNPINGELWGLFFSTMANNHNFMPRIPSIFGETRLRIPWRNLVAENTNLYFMDFYCIRNAHYVSLVLTKRGSSADKFCRSRVPLLRMDTNPFFTVRPYIDGTVSLFVTKVPIVEVFYTEEVDVGWQLSRGAKQHPVHMTGQRRGGFVGLTKNQNCVICNI